MSLGRLFVGRSPASCYYGVRTNETKDVKKCLPHRVQTAQTKSRAASTSHPILFVILQGCSPSEGHREGDVNQRRGREDRHRNPTDLLPMVES